MAAVQLKLDCRLVASCPSGRLAGWLARSVCCLDSLCKPPVSCENPLKIETARQRCTADDNDKWANLFGDDDYLVDDSH